MAGDIAFFVGIIRRAFVQQHARMICNAEDSQCYVSFYLLTCYRWLLQLQPCMIRASC